MKPPLLFRLSDLTEEWERIPEQSRLDISTKTASRFQGAYYFFALAGFIVGGGELARIVLGPLRAPLVGSLGVRLGELCYQAISGLLLLTTLFAALWVGRRRTQRLFREECRRAGQRVCIACGYDLRGQPERTRCPECGSSEHMIA
ncbi:MAG: hypothetical protein ACKVS9_15520 [Phycisphaerae bacterium]